MKKSVVLALVIAVACLCLAIFAGRKVEDARSSLSSAAAAKTHIYLPRFGVDKFLADIRWVLLIQQMGRSQGDQLDGQAAEYYADVLDAISDMDPEFAEVYAEGAMAIAYAAPDRAVALLEKARRIAEIKDWRLDFYRGFIAERFLPRAGVPVADCETLAERAYADAATPGAPAHVARAWMRLATRQAGDEPLQQLVAQKEFVLARQKESTPDFDAGAPMDGEYPHVAATSAYDGAEGGVAASLAAWVQVRARDRSQVLLQALEEAEEGPAKSAILADLEVARQVFEEMRRSAARLASDAGHICNNCLTEYGPAQFFCHHCGEKVVPYDFCPSCWGRGQRVVLSGGFCPLCGESAPAAAGEKKQTSTVR